MCDAEYCDHGASDHACGENEEIYYGGGIGVWLRAPQYIPATVAIPAVSHGFAVLPDLPVVPGAVGVLATMLEGLTRSGFCPYFAFSSPNALRISGFSVVFMLTVFAVPGSALFCHTLDGFCGNVLFFFRGAPAGPAGLGDLAELIARGCWSVPGLVPFRLTKQVGRPASAFGLGVTPKKRKGLPSVLVAHCQVAGGVCPGWIRTGRASWALPPG